MVWFANTHKKYLVCVTYNRIRLAQGIRAVYNKVYANVQVYLSSGQRGL